MRKELVALAAVSGLLLAGYAKCSGNESPYNLTPRRADCNGQVLPLRAPDRIEFEIEGRDPQTDVQLFVHADGDIGEVTGTSKPDRGATEYHPRRVNKDHAGNPVTIGEHFVIDSDEPHPNRNRICVAHIDEVQVHAGRAVTCTPWEG